MSPEACVAYLDQTLPFEFCWNALVSLKSNPETIVFCAELDLQDLLLIVLIVLYIALVPLSGIFQYYVCTFIGHPSVHFILHCMESMVIPLLYILQCAQFLLRRFIILHSWTWYALYINPSLLHICHIWPSLSVYCIATTASIV